MKSKKYMTELRKLQVELCSPPALGQGEGPARHHRVRGPRRRRQRRHHQGHHRARQPARLPRRRAAGSVGPREVADVHAAVHAALPCRRRDRHLRPQLVQPRRRRARHGLLHEGAVRRFLELCPDRDATSSTAASSSIKLWLEVSNEEQKRRFEARITDPLRQWKLSPMDLPSREKWYQYSAARDRMLKATDPKAAPWYILRSDDKEARAAERDRPHPVADRTRSCRAEDRPARPGDEGRVRRREVDQATAVREGTVLNPQLA